jgi:hypothetical protein
MAQLSPIFFLEQLNHRVNLLILPDSITHHLRVRRELDIGFKLTLSDGYLYTDAHYPAGLYRCRVSLYNTRLQNRRQELRRQAFRD